MAASSSASPAKAPNSCARSLGRRIDSANTESMLRSRTTGTAASTSRTTRSIVPESAAVGRVVRITTFILGGETPCWSRQAAFSFGYGLSYSTFRYSELKVERSAGGVLRTSARITNDSELNGDEVAQLYITSP